MIGYEKNFLITIIPLVFVILKHSLQWRGEFRLHLGPVPEFLLVNSAARRFSMAASFEGKFLCSFLYWCFHWPHLVVQVYELITCVRRANENAGNLISNIRRSVFNKYIYIYNILLSYLIWHDKTFRQYVLLDWKQNILVLIQNDTFFTLEHLFQMQISQGLISKHFSNLGPHLYDFTIRPF